MKKQIFDFLKALDANNSKEWMDAHRADYLKAKDTWLAEIELILKKLSKHNPAFASVDPKSTITRINRNRRFNPDKPIYKDNFTCTPFGAINSPAFHISISPNGSFMGGGLYRPDSPTLLKVREAIDYNGEELLKIVNSKKYKTFYGGLNEDDEMLKKAPQGYSPDHPMIELLRRKNFISTITLTQKEIISPDFPALVEKAYVAIKPLLDYMDEAVNYQE